MKELGKLKPSKPIWENFINPDIFVELEKEIAAKKEKLRQFYDESRPSDDPSFFLEKEKGLIAKMNNLKERNQDLNRKYIEATNELYKRIGKDDKEYPSSFESGDGKIYFFRLNFDPKEYKNPGREYYLEVSRSPSSGFERIRLQSDDSGSRHKRKADEIIA